MSCVYESEAISFTCIMEVIQQVKSGNISINTIRMIIKQVDSGLAQFGKPEMSLEATDISLEELIEKLELSIPIGENDAASFDWLMLLIQLLTYLLR